MYYADVVGRAQLGSLFRRLRSTNGAVDLRITTLERSTFMVDRRGLALRANVFVHFADLRSAYYIGTPYVDVARERSSARSND